MTSYQKSDSINNRRRPILSNFIPVWFETTENFLKREAPNKKKNKNNKNKMLSSDNEISFWFIKKYKNNRYHRTRLNLNYNDNYSSLFTVSGSKRTWTLKESMHTTASIKHIFIHIRQTDITIIETQRNLNIEKIAISKWYICFYARPILLIFILVKVTKRNLFYSKVKCKS